MIIIGQVLTTTVILSTNMVTLLLFYRAILFSGNLHYLWNGTRWDRVYCWWHTVYRKSHTRFIFVSNQRSWMMLKVNMQSVSKRVRLSEPTTKIWMEIFPYYQRWRGTLLFSNISFMQMLAVVLEILCKFSLDLRIPVPILYRNGML